MIRLTLLSIVIAASGCARLDNYERAYAVTWQDGDRSLTGTVTLRPNTAPKTIRIPQRIK